MSEFLPELTAGARLTARWLNALRARVMRPVRAVAPLVVVRDSADEVVFGLDVPQAADFRIVSGSNPYAGVEVYATTGGGWAVLVGGRAPTATTDPLWERNGNAAVAANSVVRATRVRATAEWLFDRSACTARSTAPTPTTPAPAPAPPAPNPTPTPAPTPTSPPAYPAPDPTPPPPDPTPPTKAPPTPTKTPPPSPPDVPPPDPTPEFPDPGYPPTPLPTPPDRGGESPMPPYPPPIGPYPGPMGSSGSRSAADPEAP